MASPNVKIANDDNFETEVLQNKLPVLIDFWAEWCGPCKAIGPTVDALADEYAGKVAVYKMNVDENSATPANLGVRGIPALFLFKNGQKVNQLIGSVPKNTLEEFIKTAL
ncbi:MAG: thioredoxin [Deltaproteobacteria bacterium]|nr:thioredoxin [Deltaproteobacteria bacterium]